MSNVLSEEKKQQVIALGRLGWSLRRIQAGDRSSPGDGSRVSEGRRHRRSGRRAAWGTASRRQNRPIEVTTDSGRRVGRQNRPNRSREPQLRPASACEPYRELIETGAVARPQCHGDLAGPGGSTTAFTGALQSVKRFVRKLRGTPAPEARGVIVTAPGEEAQVDYGTGPMVRDPHTGKYRRTRLFVLTLGYSRKSVRLLVFRSSSRIWAELHEKAFRRLGGSDSRRRAR